MPKKEILRVEGDVRATYAKLSRVYAAVEGIFEKKLRQRGLELLNIQEGETVLEIGSGTGYALVEIAKAVGETGKAYTTDQYVSNDSVWYKCLLAHTSGALDDEPGTGAVEATYWTTLSASEYTPVEEWDYMWDLPSDYLRFRSIYEEWNSTSKSRRHA